VQEIHTLERHIDHLTHQLELLSTELKEAHAQREALAADMHSQRSFSYNLELSSQDMQRYVAQLEHDKVALRSQAQDWQRELDLAKRQVELERQRYVELERLLA
jgi:chromosome segregation ATPase